MRTVTLTRDQLHELAAQVLGRGSPFVFAARGSSMLPFIREGDLLTVAPLGDAPLQAGQAVLYGCDGGALLAHRLIGRADSGSTVWLVRGDASWGETEHIRLEDILGRVVSLERNGRTQRLDTPRSLWLARLWHRLLPWSLRAYTLVSRLKSRLFAVTHRPGAPPVAKAVPVDGVATDGNVVPASIIDTIYNVRSLSDDLLTSGQPTAAQLAAVADAGYQVVINLATPDSPRALANEAALVESLGMAYEALPVVWEAPQAADFERFCALLEHYAGQRLLVHCAANMRVSAFCYLFRVLRQGRAPELAARDLAAVWEPNETWRAFIDSIMAGDTASH